jgi:octaprenyl-diphosphate synthase
MPSAATKLPECAPPVINDLPKSEWLWKQVTEPVEPFLQQVSSQLISQITEFEPQIGCLAQYILTNQGKQLRPLFLGLSAKVRGELNALHVTAGVIIELVHLATLVHDDILDEAQIRRRRPTAAAHWGNQISVLLGDCLFAHALKLAASYPTTDICRAVAAASNTVCSGEILQTIAGRTVQLSRGEYFRIVQMKTGELFGLSCQLGASLSGADEEDTSRLRRFGLLFGTAYQMYDDCLDLFGAEGVMGKSTGMDLAHGKLTLPLLIFLERASGNDRAKLVEWLRKWRPSHLRKVLNLVQKHDVLEASQEIVYQHIAGARRYLKHLPPSDSATALGTIAAFLEQQTGALGVGSGYTDSA